MGSNYVSMVLTAVIIFVCLLMAYSLYFTDFMLDGIHGGKRMIFVALMLFYAAFRSFRLYTLIKNR